MLKITNHPDLRMKNSKKIISLRKKAITWLMMEATLKKKIMQIKKND
jgi:hypothetical protein